MDIPDTTKMTTITTLIPAVGDSKKVFKLSDYTTVESISLTGLIHRGIDITIYRTSTNDKVKNQEASRIASYLMNPCTIYDINILGDCILRIELLKTSPLINQLPVLRSDQITKIFTWINQVYDEKDKGVVPSDYLEWYKKREEILSSKLKEMKDAGKDTKVVEMSLQRLRESPSTYGKKITLPANV